MSSFEQMKEFEQFLAIFSGQLGSCRAILNNFWKHDMALLTLDSVQNVSIEAALKHLTLAEKGS